MLDKIFLARIHAIIPILKKISLNKGICFLVGGAVRDLALFKLTNKSYDTFSDLDIEVHGLEIGELKSCLDSFSPTILVGKQFGVLRMPFYSIDWSLPRTDSIGRKPTVIIDKDLSIEDALQRRDVTIGAIAINLTEHLPFFIDYLSQKQTKRAKKSVLKNINFIDPFFGLEHLKLKKLHPVYDIKFKEDPLRLFRVMQFISRFNFSTTTEMDNLCKVLPFSLTKEDSLFFIAKERITQEVSKMLSKSKNAFKGLLWLEETVGLADIFPEIQPIFYKLSHRSWLFSSSYKLSKIFTGQDLLFANLVLLVYCIKDSKKISLFINRFSFSASFCNSIKTIAKILQKDVFDELSLKLLAEVIFPFTVVSFLQLSACLGVISLRKKRLLLRLAKSKGFSDRPIKHIITGAILQKTIPAGPVFKELIHLAYLKQLGHQSSCFFNLPASIFE